MGNILFPLKIEWRRKKTEIWVKYLNFLHLFFLKPHSSLPEHCYQQFHLVIECQPSANCWKFWDQLNNVGNPKRKTYSPLFRFPLSDISQPDPRCLAWREKGFLVLEKFLKDLVFLPGFLGFLVFHRRERCHSPFSSDWPLLKNQQLKLHLNIKNFRTFSVYPVKCFLHWSCHSCWSDYRDTAALNWVKIQKIADCGPVQAHRHFSLDKELLSELTRTSWGHHSCIVIVVQTFSDSHETDACT